MTEYTHQKYALGFEVSTDHLRESAAKAGLSLEEYLKRLERSVPGVEILPAQK